MATSPTYPSAAARDRAARNRAKLSVAATELGADHPAVALAQRWIEVLASVATVKAYADGLVRYFSWCARSGTDPFTESKLDAGAFVAALSAAGHAPNTVAIRVAAAASFISTAVGEGVVARNPFTGLKKPAADAVIPTPTLNSEQADHLAQLCLEALDDPSLVRQRNAAACYLMFRTGPRSAEVADGRFGHLSNRPEGVTWRVHGKGNRWSSLLLPLDVVDVLTRWQAALEERIGRPVRPDDALVPSLGPRSTGLRADAPCLEPVEANTISRFYSTYLAEIGIEGPRFTGHSARATAACLAYTATRDLLAVQRMLRHKTPTMTERYLRGLILPSAAAAWTPSAYRAKGGKAA